MPKLDPNHPFPGWAWKTLIGWERPSDHTGWAVIKHAYRKRPSLLRQVAEGQFEYAASFRSMEMAQAFADEIRVSLLLTKQEEPDAN